MLGGNLHESTDHRSAAFLVPVIAFFLIRINRESKR